MTTFGLFVILILCIVGSHCQEYCETPPSMDNVIGCCKSNITQQQMDCMLEVKRQHKMFLQSDDKDSFPKTTELCLSNCMFNSTNIITSDNEINFDLVGNIFEVMVRSESSLNMLKFCKEWIENIKSRASGKESKYGKCDIRMEKLAFCLVERWLSTCPDSMWENTSECSDMRTYLKNCPYEKRGGHQRLPPQ